jgi:hypothetical protein
MLFWCRKLRFRLLMNLCEVFQKNLYISSKGKNYVQDV